MIGVDIIKVSRVAKLAKADVEHRVFTKDEMCYAYNKAIVKTRGETCSQKDNTLAGIFCAKEAFLKALGMGIGDLFKLSEIEISHYESGQPYIVETDKIKSHLRLKNLSEINLSISHDNGMAIAMVEVK